MITVSLYSFIVGGLAPVLAPVMMTLQTEFHKPLSLVSYVIGVYFIALGVSSCLIAPTAAVYGKRLAYLLSQIVLLGGLAWGAKAQSFGSLLGARALMGLGGGAAESLPSATIAEIFFAHERAYRSGIYTLLLIGDKNIMPLI